MKKKMIYAIIVSLLIVIIGFVLLNWNSFLFQANNFKVYTEKGESVPIRIFHRNNNYLGRKDRSIMKEILLYIPESISMNMKGVIADVLSIDRNDPSIMGCNGGRNSFIKIGNFVLFQGNYYMSNDFWPLYNNRIIYDNKEDEPIKFFIAEGNTYKFNTFGGLKAYGDTVILEKLDGPIEKEVRYISSD